MITQNQAVDLLVENYGGHLSYEDPEWWQNMTDWLTQFRSVRHLRAEHPNWRLPAQWPGAEGQSDA